MINQETFQKLAEGDQATVKEVGAAILAGRFTQPEIVCTWKSLIEALIAKKGVPSGLVDLGIKLNEVSQNPEAREIYEKLFILAAYPLNPQSHVAIIGVGASVVRINKGEVAAPAVDKSWYLETARKCLISTIHSIEGAMKKARDDGKEVDGLEQNVIYLLEALRHVEGPEIKAELAAITRNGFGNRVRDVAGQSIGPLRIRDELEGAKADREFLLETVYPDPTAPQSMFVECIFTAVETAYSPKATETEMAVAVMQLASFGAHPDTLKELFDAHSLKIITRNVENALLHALTHGDAKVRAGAAGGLQKIGSDRIEDILERIVVRVGEGNETGALASEALSTIRGGKVEIFEVTFPPPRAGKPAPPQLRARPSPTTNINQA